uniref:dual specificity tyrosine-phosphorylation-regulated kinase 3-like n=1 Tax=Styela clava TaxID=7725 RepID=UPI00193939B0|nr:dual specificity tyrosine-phosphorylation-regulated kinase 3-like [Styela clava]
MGGEPYADRILRDKMSECNKNYNRNIDGRMFHLRTKRKIIYTILACVPFALLHFIINSKFADKDKKSFFVKDTSKEDSYEDLNNVNREELYYRVMREAEVAFQAQNLNLTVKSFYNDIFQLSDSRVKFYRRKNYDEVEKSLVNESRVEDSFLKYFPMSPEDAIRRFGSKLPYWEKYEILNYPKVYYLGLNANKTQLKEDGKNNFGFDFDTLVENESEGNYDVSGHYKMVPGDHIGYRYEIIKYVDTGYYCDVVVARDWSNPILKNVAIKIMRVRGHSTLRPFWQEVGMLQYLNTHASNLDYFTRMLATFEFRNHPCIVFELLGGTIDLKYLKHSVRNTTLIRRYASDALHGLRILNKIGVLHGDFKLHNLMYIHGKNNESNGQLIKIGDFGGSCVVGQPKCGIRYYFITRAYRAPEIIFNLQHTTQIDMFSFGVWLAELFLGQPPFYGEDNEEDHLGAMMEVLGLPPSHMIAKSPRKHIYWDAFRHKIHDKGTYRRPYSRPLLKVLEGMDFVLIDLICRCLEWDPNLRITPEEALRHPSMTGVEKDLEEYPIVIQRFLGKI